MGRSVTEDKGLMTLGLGANLAGPGKFNVVGGIVSGRTIDF